MGTYFYFQKYGNCKDFRKGGVKVKAEVAAYAPPTTLFQSFVGQCAELRRPKKAEVYRVELRSICSTAVYPVE
jgi:hypothetical protein